MSDTKKTFHESALESILFKGRHDQYFCYLKAEKIAHVLALLCQKATEDHILWFEELVDQASSLPSTVVHFVAGEIEVEILLANIFSLLSSVRLSATWRLISQETASLIVQEYEGIAEKIAAGSRLSPFVSRQDFSVPEFLEQPARPPALALSDTTYAPRTVFKGNIPKRHVEAKESSQKPEGRSTAILQFVRQNTGVSIKDICAVVPGCSEKTVQRELISLIGQGLIKREGERRWSVYKPA